MAENFQEKRTILGKIMYNITMTIGKWLTRHMWVYHILSYTWGLLTTIIGWLCYGFVKLFLRKKLQEEGKFGPSHYLLFGNNWGGLEMGTNFFVAGNMSKEWTLHTKCHEVGHNIQNAIWGPFNILISFIPSVIRYWYQRIRRRKGKEVKAYDLIWFEGSATDLGEYYYNHC